MLKDLIFEKELNLYKVNEYGWKILILKIKFFCEFIILLLYVEYSYFVFFVEICNVMYGMGFLCNVMRFLNIVLICM